MEPRQGQHRALQSFHVLKTYLHRDAHLVLVGPVADPGYSAALELFLLEMALPDVHFAAELHEAQLELVYQRADVVLSMAAGGRLTAGLTEAMGLRVPVVARGPGPVVTAVSGGIVIDQLGSVLAAEAVARILNDSSVRRRLRAGREFQPT